MGVMSLNMWKRSKVRMILQDNKHINARSHSTGSSVSLSYVGVREIQEQALDKGTSLSD